VQLGACSTIWSKVKTWLAVSVSEIGPKLKTVLLQFEGAVTVPLKATVWEELVQFVSVTLL